MGSNPIPGATTESTAFVEYLSRERRLAASTLQEFTALLESGFEYVSDFEGKKILRKRK